MTDLDFVLGVIGARAEQHKYIEYGCVCAEDDDSVDGDDMDWEAEKALCLARSQALKDVAEEIRASLPVEGAISFENNSGITRTFWALSTAMAGAMHARLFPNYEAAYVAQEEYMHKFRMTDEYFGFGSCGINRVKIAARRTKATGSLDGRYALIMYNMHETEASIHENYEELENAIEEFKETVDFDCPASSSLYGYHEILIPK